jgi:hypothetical protein
MNKVEINLNKLTNKLNKCVKYNCSKEYKHHIKENATFLMKLFNKMDKIKSNKDIDNTFMIYNKNKYQYKYNYCLAKKCNKLVIKIALYIINVCKHLLKDGKNKIPIFIKRIIHKCEKTFKNRKLMNSKNLQRRSFEILFLTKYISKFNYVIAKPKL